MSASREKKSRQENLAGGYVDPRTKREKDEQAKDRRSNALYIAIAVIFVIVGIVVTVANSKVIERSADAVTIGNETYTAADVSYFYNTIYNSFVSQNSYYLSVYGLDTSKSLKEQDCPVTDGGTWYDYFRDQALESLKSYALLAQKAEAEGFDASEEVEQSVQETLSDLDASAASAGYTRAQYIKAVCGPLVNEKVFERNIRMMALAQAYSNSYSDSLSYTSDEVQAAYDADPKSYQSVDIEYILFSSGAGSDATDEEKAQLLDEAKQKAETALSRYAQGEAFDAIGEDMEGSYAHVAYAANGSSDMLTWAFDDARQAGDTTVAAYGETGYYAVLFHSRSRNDYHTVSVRHILIKAEKSADGTYTDEAKAAAKARAEEILAEFNSGDKTEDSFAELANKYSEDEGSNTNGGLYENIAKGQMVQEFNDFCFAGHKAGDTGIVYGESSSYAGYHVMYFVGAGEQYSDYLAKNSLLTSDMNAWLEELTSAYETSVGGGIRFVGK